MIRTLSIRWKLTLWYGGVLAIILLGFGAAVYFILRHQLLERMDQGLTEELADVLSEVGRARDEPGLSQWLDRRFAHHEGFDFQITREDGSRFFVNQRLRNGSLPLPEGPALRDAPAFRNVTRQEASWRVVSVQAQGPGEVLVVQVARSLAALEHESRELLVTLLLIGPITLLATVGGGYFLARRALAPVDRITATANQITVDRLSQRIEIDNPDDELGALGRTLNRMIERLEQSFAEMQRFTADAAHELRTPLAVIRTEAEVALRTRRSADEYERVLGNLLEEANRLGHLAERLLFLCRQDAGLHMAQREEVQVDAVLREVVGNMQLVAQEKGVSVSIQGNPPCTLQSDPRLLRRLLYNVLDNAIKYTARSGQVRVTASVGPGGWSAAIADTGVGIPAEHLAQVFERFYRVDAARTDDGGGAGLGLAICRSIVKSLGGDITLTSTAGQGTSVKLAIPNAG